MWIHRLAVRLELSIPCTSKQQYVSIADLIKHSFLCCSSNRCTLFIQFTHLEHLFSRITSCKCKNFLLFAHFVLVQDTMANIPEQIKIIIIAPLICQLAKKKVNLERGVFLFIELLVLPGQTKENIIHVESEELNN